MSGCFLAVVHISLQIDLCLSFVSQPSSQLPHGTPQLLNESSVIFEKQPPQLPLGRGTSDNSMLSAEAKLTWHDFRKWQEAFLDVIEQYTMTVNTLLNHGALLLGSLVCCCNCVNKTGDLLSRTQMPV
jgi:hypothetical protein